MQQTSDLALDVAVPLLRHGRALALLDNLFQRSVQKVYGLVRGIFLFLCLHATCIAFTLSLDCRVDEVQRGVFVSVIRALFRLRAVGRILIASRQPCPRFPVLVALSAFHATAHCFDTVFALIGKRRRGVLGRRKKLDDLGLEHFHGALLVHAGHAGVKLGHGCNDLFQRRLWAQISPRLKVALLVLQLEHRGLVHTLPLHKLLPVRTQLEPRARLGTLVKKRAVAVLDRSQERNKGNVAHASVAVEKSSARVRFRRVCIHTLDTQVRVQHAHFAVFALDALQPRVKVVGGLPDHVVGRQQPPLRPRQVVAQSRREWRLLHQGGHGVAVVLQHLKARARVQVWRLAAVVCRDCRAVRAHVLGLPQQPPAVRLDDHEGAGQSDRARRAERHDPRVCALHQLRAVQVDAGNVACAIQGAHKALEQRLDLPLCRHFVLMVVVVVVVFVVQRRPLQCRRRVHLQGHFCHDAGELVAGFRRGTGAEHADVAGFVQEGVGGRLPWQRVGMAGDVDKRQHRPRRVGGPVRDGAMRKDRHGCVLNAIVCQQHSRRLDLLAAGKCEALLHAHLQKVFVLA